MGLLAICLFAICHLLQAESKAKQEKEKKDKEEIQKKEEVSTHNFSGTKSSV
jgi:hypothetical protein